MLANLPRACQSEKYLPPAGVNRTCKIIPYYRRPAAPPPREHLFDCRDQFIRRVTQDKIRARNLRRLETHLQNRKSGIVVVHGVGDFSLLRSTEAMANQGQVQFFRFPYRFNFSQSQRGTDGESLLFQQELPDRFKNRTGSYRQDCGHVF